MRGLNPDQLRAFVQVVELGSFSAAAARLNLTQPAVSQQVRQLEERLGLRLVERVGRRATATAAGTELLVHARGIEAAIDAALDAMGQQDGGEMGRVRIGTGSTACIYLLPPLLRDLRQRFPGLEIMVNTGTTADILKSLEANALDLALVTLPAPGRMFAVTPLMTDDVLAVEAADAASLPERVTPAALAKRPLFLEGPNSQTRRVIEGWFRHGGLRVKPAMAVDNVEAIKEMVGVGLGCSVLPGVAVAGAAARTISGVALRVKPLSPRLQRELGLVMRRDKVLTRGLRETVKALMRLKRSGR